jgi:hypothetical protein
MMEVLVPACACFIGYNFVPTYLNLVVLVCACAVDDLVVDCPMYKPLGSQKLQGLPVYV